MSIVRVDYHQLAPTYDERYSVNSLEAIRRALAALIQQGRPALALETGCGTGYWLRHLAGGAARLYGLDFSLSMLRKAAPQDSRARLICADAVRLPYACGEFDLVFCVNAIHHSGDPAAYIKALRGCCAQAAGWWRSASIHTPTAATGAYTLIFPRHWRSICAASAPGIV